MTVEPDKSFVASLKIDKYALDTMSVGQPELYATWGINWADAVNDRDRNKDRLSLIKSECDNEIRQSPSEFGWTKNDKPPTETFILSAIARHPAFIEANEDYLASCHEVNVLAVAKEAFEQRKRMIEILVQLYSSSYFSTNKDYDVNYNQANNKIATQSQLENLESNPRLARRKVNGTLTDGI